LGWFSFPIGKQRSLQFDLFHNVNETKIELVSQNPNGQTESESFSILEIQGKCHFRS